jgi:hypothetical protein
MEFENEGLSIRALIREVTREVLSAQADRIASGEPAVFELSDLTLEVSFVATSSKKAGGGFDLKVVKADAGLQYDKESIHKVSLKLVAVVDQEQPFGVGKVRPQLRETEPGSPNR